MTEAALLAAILDAPEDDMPRLILADWWDENGQSDRAEFCRVQCEAERLDWIVTSGIFTPGPPSNAPDTSKEFGLLCALRRRERELLERCYSWSRFGGYGIAPATYDSAIVKLFPPGGGSEIANVNFRRGFVHSITLSAADWLKHGDAILAAQPVEEVTLTTWPGWAMNAPEENTRRNLHHNWPRIKKWTLPATSYSNYEIGLVEERQETQRSRSHDIR